MRLQRPALAGRWRIPQVIFLCAVLNAACSTTGTSGTPAPVADAPAITGVDWHWVASRYTDKTETRPPDPARYRLRLEPDGAVRARLDCNQGGGRYRIDGSAIAIEVMHSTRAACGPESLDSAFSRDPDAAATYSIREARLYLQLKSGAGTMEFAPK